MKYLKKVLDRLGIEYIIQSSLIFYTNNFVQVLIRIDRGDLQQSGRRDKSTSVSGRK